MKLNLLKGMAHTFVFNIQEVIVNLTARVFNFYYALLCIIINTIFNKACTIIVTVSIYVYYLLITAVT